MAEEKGTKLDTATALLPEPSPPVAPTASKKPQYLAALAATLGAMAAGTCLAWTSPTIPVLTSSNCTDVCVTEEEASWIGSLVAVGALGGSLPSGYLADRYGRQPFILALSVPFIVSWLLVIAAKSAAVLYIARFCAGLACGGISVVAPMYIAEIADSSVRGALGAFFQVMLTLGILYTYTVGAITGYTGLGLLSGCIPIIFAICFIWVPESPTFLLKKNKKNKAEKSLLWLRGSNHDIHSELSILQMEVEENSKRSATCRDLISSSGAKKAMVISLGLMAAQQLSGINAVIFYTVDIFKAAGSTLEPSVAAIIVGIVQVIMSYVSSILVDRAGRRILLLLSSGVMAVSLTALGFYFHLKIGGTDISKIGWLPLVCVVVFIIMFSLGFGPIPWMMVGEIFPAPVKGIASGIAVSLNWTLVFLVTLTFTTLLRTLGDNLTFYLFALICVLSFIFTFFLVPETKGKSLAEIQSVLNNKRPSTNHII